MKISDVAGVTGLPAKTIRYYDDIGLVQPARSTNGYREFTDTDSHKLAFLARARALGFTIEECRTLLSLYGDRTRGSAEVRQVALEHLEHIERKILELQAMRATLEDLVARCHGDDRPECPILDELAGQDPRG
jgi:Cu(I)-responsive transcriptional regulator